MKNNKKVNKKGKGAAGRGSREKERNKKKRQTWSLKGDWQCQRANATVAANNLHKF